MKHFIERLRWRTKQALAGESRYYGDGGTIHSSGFLNVEVHQGEVVAVWFRCQALPFRQSNVDERRAESMRRMSDEICRYIALTGVEVRDDGI